MAGINDAAAIARRAKALAERDGFAWEISFQPAIPGAKIKPQPYLEDERRQRYLDQARAELRKEVAASASRDNSPDRVKELAGAT
jgi:hypothetical protein